MPSNIPVAPKSQYEIERDERIKRNEAFMLSIGIDPHGGGYMKQNKKKAPPKPRLPRKKVPESERRRSSRLQGGTAGPERLTYDEWSDDERPRQRSRGSGGRRARKNRLVELSEEQRAALESFNIYDFEASASASFTKPRDRRDSVITLHIYTGFWSPTASTRSPTTTGARSSARSRSSCRARACTTTRPASAGPTTSSSARTSP